ncbi:IS1182 family transposase [Gracilibacillus salinarum]|uniref:IS1182 family transposase n=1 Tax=Gracilibacillus salinarum TaxID=2932255 RepID=A0ABY4GHU6_9BACI|nr:IS1182 family transposase [Gracilibacillus salinarum]UOQ83776.1 IS1182 family transposase [Gracilibacillus salinarum]
MIERQTSLQLSPYAELYDKLIPKDHFLRRFCELVDFSFIEEALSERYCMNNGRNAVHPIRMFKYLLLKQIFDLSDVDVVERSKTDLAYKYFLGMAPEEDVIHPSSLTKFRKLRIQPLTQEEETENLLDLLIQKSVQVAKEQDVMASDAIIVDATHSSSRYCAKSADEFLKEKAKSLRKTVYRYDESVKEKFPEKPVNEDVNETRAYCADLVKTIQEETRVNDMPAIKEKCNLLEEVLADCEEASIQSEDPDAKIGYKSQDHAFFGYKTHLSLSLERIITGATVTTGEKNDGKYLKELVYKSRAAGMNVKTVIGDRAYSGTENLKYAESEEGNIQLISRLHPVITNGKEHDNGFVFHKDADTYACPAGHLAIKKKVKPRKEGDNRNTQLSYYFDVKKCQICPLREGCFKGTKTKSYSVTLKSNEHLLQEAFQETDLFKALARERYMIEAKNSELKNRHGYDKAKNSGLFGMRLQSAATIFVVNIKRIMKLIDEKNTQKETK